MKKVLAIVATTLGALGLASTAQAHHGSITADCEKVTISLESFHYATTINYTIVRSPGGTVTGSFPITTAAMTKVIPLKSYGTTTITASASWTGKETGSIRPTTIKVVCAEAPAPTPVTPAPAAPTPAPAAPAAPSVPAVNVPTNVPVTTQRPESGGSSTPEAKRRANHRSKRCVEGRRRYDSKGRRLRDSQGKRISLPCQKKSPIRNPQFAGQRGPTPRFTG